MPNGWSWTEDRQWASSRTIKGGNFSSYAWELEVRSENYGAGTQRLGTIFFVADAAGDLKMSTRTMQPEEDGA